MCYSTDRAEEEKNENKRKGKWRILNPVFGKNNISPKWLYNRCDWKGDRFYDDAQYFQRGFI